MAGDHLGLFDTPASRQHVRLSLVVCGLLLAVFLIVFPLRNIPLAQIDAFIPVVDAVQFVDELIICVLLYAQGAVYRSRALAMLASGYLFSALMLVPHALTFPGAFSPEGLLGAQVSTTAWLGGFRRLSFPAAIILYALFRRADSAVTFDADRPPVRTLLWIAGAVALAAIATMAATLGHGLLPPLFTNARDGIYLNLIIMCAATAIVTAIASFLLFRHGKSVLDLWLLVAMAAWIGQLMPVQDRFSLGWYYLFCMLLPSNLIVMVALLAESNRLYVRLALAAAARDREREARLMSMDAVAAAIAHEIGQPLAAISMNAGVCLRNLSGDRPDPDRAIKSTRSTLDAANRAFDVIKSVRAMYSKGASLRSQFSLNDLVVESAALLDWEIVAQRISIDIDLDPDLPPIDANRVQVQRILVNLLTNAIEAVAEGRDRRIGVRTARLGNEEVLLEVTDSGVGIPPENLAKIFEPFVTTKKTGTGLGLSLCRVIVEEHGGRLWVTPGAVNGVTFHLQMPRSSVAVAA